MIHITSEQQDGTDNKTLIFEDWSVFKWGCSLSLQMSML